MKNVPLFCAQNILFALVVEYSTFLRRNMRGGKNEKKKENFQSPPLVRVGIAGRLGSGHTKPFIGMSLTGKVLSTRNGNTLNRN